MRIEMVSGFLLPAGIWLIVSAGASLQAQRRLASATLIALATSLLTFVAFGFALAFGGIGANVPKFADVLNAPVAIRGAQDTWVFAGATGFLLSATAQAIVLTLFVQTLPLLLTGAVLMAGVLAQRARPIAQLILIVVTCGVALPLAGGWLWAHGWLHTLGARDLGQLAVVGLVAGGAGLAWLRATPRREMTQDPHLPEAQFPSRAIAGVLLVLAGTAGVLMATDADVALRQFVNAAGAVAAFTTRNADTLSASRAMLAAIFMSSAGAANLPTWLAVLLGVACGVLATLGYYWVNEKRLLHDDNATLTAMLLPAALGMIVAGVFAGAGAFIAQMIAVVSITVLAYALVRSTLWLARVLRWPVLAMPAIVTEAAPLLTTIPINAAVTSEAQPAPTSNMTESPIYIAEAALHAPANEVSKETAPQKRRGLLAWLRRETATDTSPKQPRKVAYPYRIGGRRMSARPVAGETPPVDSASTIDAS